MYVIRALFFVCLLLSAHLSAQPQNEQGFYGRYIDEKHKTFSNYVVKVFESVDTGLSGWVKEDDDEKACIGDECNNDIDEFFKDEKFLEESEKSFLRIRLGSTLQSKDSADFDYKIRAQIPLKRTKRNFQLFIEDIEKSGSPETAAPLPLESTENPKGSTAVGVSYFAPVYKNIKSKYSIGISSFTPYAKARFSKDFKKGGWLIQPTQQFKYSIKSEWTEETNLYIDKTLTLNSLLRTTLHRKTQSHVNGFDYALSFTYYNTVSQKKGFSFTQQFWGNSRYACDVSPEPYNGISNYSSFFSWKQNIFRKWISFELSPGVSFHRRYEYEPNYVLGLNFDFYFGNI